MKTWRSVLQVYLSILKVYFLEVYFSALQLYFKYTIQKNHRPFLGFTCLCGPPYGFMDIVQLSVDDRVTVKDLLLTSKSPGILHIHQIALWRMKPEAVFQQPYSFEPGMFGLVDLHLNH